MKTRITNIVKYLLASAAMLVSAVCANAQDYDYPPVDAVTVTPGASGVRVDWGFPIATISDNYQFAVVTYSKRVEGSITYYDMVSSDTVSSTTHSVYASIVDGAEYLAGTDYYARVTPISSARTLVEEQMKPIKTGQPKESARFRIKPSAYTITVKIFDTYKDGNVVTASPDYFWVQAYGVKYTDGQTIKVANGENIRLSGHTGYPEGSDTYNQYGFCRWIVDGVSYYDSTAYDVTPTRNMTVYMCVGKLALDNISPYSTSKYSEPNYHERIGQSICGNSMVDPNSPVVLTTDQQLYCINTNNEISPVTIDEIKKHVTFSKLNESTGTYVEQSFDQCDLKIKNDGTESDVEFYNSPSVNMDHNTQYKIEVKPTVDGVSICDQYGNILEYEVCIFTTQPEATRIIRVTDKFANTYKNGASQSVGSVWKDASVNLTKTFVVLNDGTSDLTVSNSGIEGTGYSITGYKLKKDGVLTSYSTTSSVRIRCAENVTKEATSIDMNAPDSLFVTVQYSASAGLADGVHAGVLKVNSNDNAENANYELNLTVKKGDFFLPYSYRADGETKEEDGTLYQNYSSVNDVPDRITIGGVAPVEGSTYYQEYYAYTSEGSCVVNGSSAIRAGGLTSNRLSIDVSGTIPHTTGLDGVGQILIKWSANGYRKIKIFDNNGTTYLSTPLLRGGVCHEHSVIVSSCKQTTPVTNIYVEFEGPEENVLTTISQLDITPCDAELQSSLADITDFKIAGATNVRIYNDVIFLELPEGSCNPSTITPEIIVSPGATVSPASGAPNSLRKEVSSLSGLTSQYFQYIVTASNNETRKTYKVFVDCPQGTSGCFGNEVDVSVLMNKQDQTIEILEIQSGECTVPVSGNGSTRTLHYLTKEDKPLNGVYEISGPRVVCIGSIAEYAISNAAESNGAKYHWVISRAPGTTEKESFTVINGVSDTIYSAADPNVIEEILQIYDGETMQLQAPNSLTNAQIALKIIIDLEYTDKQCALLSGQANAEIYATKLPPTQVTQVSAGCVGDDGRLKIQATQSDYNDEYKLPIDATTYVWNFSPSYLNSKYTEVLGDPSTIYVDLGEDVPDIHVIVGVQNGCGVGPNSNDLYVDYAAHQTEWLGTVSNEWHNNKNWTHHVPAACTDVIIRDVTSTNDAAQSETEEFYEKSGHYPEIEDGRTGECKNITFRPGAGVKGLDRLTYKRAFVQVDLQRNVYYTLTAPLGDMYSGDFYFGGMPEMEIRFFKDVLPDSKRSTGAVSEDWTQPFQTLDAELYGKGILYRVSDSVWNYPNGLLLQNTSKVITFPRMNTDSSLVTTVYPHSSFTGKLFTKIPVKLDKTENAYRFAAEAGTGSLPTQFTLSTDDDGLTLIPNPLMTHLDVVSFLADNSEVLAGNAKFWNGKNFNSFMSGADLWNNPDEGSYLDCLLMPPMQAFLVEVISGGDEIVYDYDNHFKSDVDGAYDLRADKKKDVMYVQTANSSASIAKRDGKNNGYNKNEDSFKLFPVLADKQPNVYTLTGGMAVDINQFGQYPFVAPIGVKTNREEPTDVTLKFKGAESFSDVDVILVNNKTGEEVNLKDESSYMLTVTDSVDNSTLQIEFRNSQDVSTNASDVVADESGIQIFVENGNTIKVLCASDNKINTVEVFGLTGRTITKHDNINSSHFNLTLNSGASTVTVRATTEKGVKVEKVLIR